MPGTSRSWSFFLLRSIRETFIGDEFLNPFDFKCQSSGLQRSVNCFENLTLFRADALNIVNAQ